MSSALKQVLMWGRPIPARFVDAVAANPANSPESSGFGSAAENDFAIIAIAQSNGTTPSVSGGAGVWSMTSVAQSGNTTWVLWKKLVTADLGGVTVTFGGSETIVAADVYRGAYDAVVAGAAGSTTGSNTVTGFAPNFRSVGVVSVFAMDNNEGLPPTTAPSGFATRYKGTGSNPGPGDLYSMAIADLLTSYAGANITWTNQANPNRQIVLDLIG